ncbi:MAG TPA: hypothetical protein PK294_13750 [Ignavibacteria bacterium]|nr:hypothetical protein [Ignavibacteria bacterium]
MGKNFKLQITYLKVYDDLGKDIITLINEKKYAGNYNVYFYRESLPDGVYYYRLEAGDLIEILF